MIKIETAHIEEVRGIRRLAIDFQKSTFAISGPNGSGKSGVIDAIEFGLTGQISRLTGSGTQGLSVSEHGPHVDKTKFPDAAFVEVRVFLPALGKSATITRKVSSPNKPKIEPTDADIKAALAELEDHPEIMLSRREILRFILVAPTKRGAEIQTLLKLDDIGNLRTALNTAHNTLQRSQRTTAANVQTQRDALQRHLQVAILNRADLLEAVNKRRRILGLPELMDLPQDAKLDAGLSAAANVSDFNKASALSDLAALADAAAQFPDLARTEAAAIIEALGKLEADPALLAALRRRAFVENGLELVDGPDCPLCDTAWPDEQHLRDHLRAKLAKSEEARLLQQSLLDNGAAIARDAQRVASLLDPALKVADGQRNTDFATLLRSWKRDVDELMPQLATVEGLAALKDRLASGLLAAPPMFSEGMSGFRQKVQFLPDQPDTLAAQTYLTTAQLRFDDFREAKRKNKTAEAAVASAKAAYDAYCSVMDAELNALYAEVQEDFSTFYRAINEEDEAKFTAKLTPSEGQLDFAVNFYERGLFPPAAFHSEGHQDGMGVCLYLALMKRLFGAQFTFALLDDVVMSVDVDHRYQFCKLLKQHFPDTQFIITTHDRLWAEQMKAARLVTTKTSMVFHSWTIDTGPLVESHQEIWDEIAAALGRGKVEGAAAALRRHLEYVSRHLADQLGATVQFRADGNFELGDLLPAVLARTKSLYAKAAEAAQSWGNNPAKDAAGQRKAALAASAGAYNVEQWAVNKAVHYNEWANFGRKDFEPVVAAFKDLLSCLRCPDCEAWLYVTPRVSPDTLRCPCNRISLSLKSKPK
ncbi:ATP-binding protein [Candidatus Binatia bacterium]|nr:ATP-binding protein [Microbacteriaceae bacterium]MBY0280448.1 ATP-binding protein [Candidatus Binatia bacterium]